MMIGVGALSLAQKDGKLPTTLAVGSAPGESGVSVLRVRFQGELHLSATLRQHLICFQYCAPRTCFDCRIAGRALRHQPPSGSLAICPAGVDCSADAPACVEAILVTIDPQRLALATADAAVLGTCLMERFSGYDHGLLALADALARECALGFPHGPLSWNDTASRFIEALISRHTDTVVAPCGMLGNDVLLQLRDYVVEHLHEPIGVTTLAKIVGRSPFHFSRVFSRSVGASPHRYVVHLRLQRAIELVREGRASLAQIAVRTGFADQSHLCRWVRRVHGVSLTKLSTARERDSRNLHEPSIASPQM